MTSILDEAREIIHGDREQTHGEPDKNLRAIAHIWTAILAAKLRPGTEIGPEFVCLMMAGVKLARAANRPAHREHALDVVGYMALMERCDFLESSNDEASSAGLSAVDPAHLR
jgi:hypothetical protein